MSRHESTCPTCGESFVAIGRHWGYGECGFPTFDRAQRELLAGLLAGDGFIRAQSGERDKDAKWPAFEVELTDPEYVDWVAERLEPFTSNVTDREQPDGRRDTRRMYTVGHPDLQAAAFICQMDTPTTLPFGYVITPAILNTLYATRGSLSWTDGGANVRIHPRGSFAHILTRWLDERGWQYNVVRDGELYLSRAHTEAFYDYIGDAPPGFVWKWQHDDEVAYREGAPTRGDRTDEPEVDLPPEPIVADHDDLVNVNEGYREGKKVHLLRERADGYYERVCGLYDDGLAFDHNARQVTADGFLRLPDRCLQCGRYADLPDRPKTRQLDFDPVEAGLLGGDEDTSAATVNLEPDWEWLAAQLERLGFPSWAEDARAKRMTPREVYGPVLTILYRYRHANAEDIARL